MLWSLCRVRSLPDARIDVVMHINVNIEAQRDLESSHVLGSWASTFGLGPGGREA